MHVEEVSGTLANRPMLKLSNNGGAVIRTTNSGGTNWDLAFRSNHFAFDTSTGTDLMRVYDDGRVRMGPNATSSTLAQFRLATNGDLTITGNLSQGSSRTFKEGFGAVDPSAVLDKVTQLEISEWSYKSKTDRHLGPMAEDFAELFGLGQDERHLAPADVAGVALAAIQALEHENNELKAANDSLQQRLEQLEAAVARLVDSADQ